MFFVLSCSVWDYEDNSSPNDNRYPETYLSLIASDTIYAIIDEIISVTDTVSGVDISDTTWFYELETPLNIDSTILVDTLLNSFTTVTTSRQELHWWGEDTDGEVVGYQYRWNTDSTWKETMSE